MEDKIRDSPSISLGVGTHLAAAGPFVATTIWSWKAGMFWIPWSITLLAHGSEKRPLEAAMCPLPCQKPLWWMEENSKYKYLFSYSLKAEFGSASFLLDFLNLSNTYIVFTVCQPCTLEILQK